MPLVVELVRLLEGDFRLQSAQIALQMTHKFYCMEPAKVSNSSLRYAEQGSRESVSPRPASLVSYWLAGAGGQSGRADYPARAFSQSG
jgi:hypothetical protein